jgi:hypothetical protein
VKQDRAEAADAQLNAEAEQSAQYGSTGKVHPHKKEVESMISGTRVGELKRTYKFYKYHMLGTASCWFLLDVVFYANGLFNHDVTSLILSNGLPTTALEVSIYIYVYIYIYIYIYICHIYMDIYTYI